MVLVGNIVPTEKGDYHKWRRPSERNRTRACILSYHYPFLPRHYLFLPISKQIQLQSHISKLMVFTNRY